MSAVDSSVRRHLFGNTFALGRRQVAGVDEPALLRSGQWPLDNNTSLPVLELCDATRQTLAVPPLSIRPGSHGLSTCTRSDSDR